MKKVLAAALAVSLAVPALAQGRNCGPRSIFVENLAEKYQETRQSIGLAANNTVLEVFANLETGTWTILITSANGVTCAAASGGEFSLTATAPAPTGERL